MSKKTKLLLRLQERPKTFTWDEAVTLMKACNFDLMKAPGGGSARRFIHKTTRVKVRLHEPHPQNTLLPYMLEALEEGLRNAGEI